MRHLPGLDGFLRDKVRVSMRLGLYLFEESLDVEFSGIF